MMPSPPSRRRAALNPDDKTIPDLLRQAQNLRDEAKRGGDVQKLLTDGRAAMKLGDLDSAQKAFDAAFVAAPTNQDVITARADLQKARDELAKKPFILVSIKTVPEPDKAFTSREVQSGTVATKISDLAGKVLKDDKPNMTEEDNHTFIVIDKGDKFPRKYLVHYDKASIRTADQTVPYPYQGRSIQFEVKDGKYQWTAPGNPALTDKDLQQVLDKANDNLKSSPDSIFLPTRPVREGEGWKVDDKSLLDQFGKDYDIDLTKSTARARLASTYQKNGKQFGVIEIDLKLTLKRMDRLQLDSPVPLNVSGSLTTAIDGSSTERKMALGVKFSGKGSYTEAGVNYVMERILDFTDNVDHSEELAATDMLVKRLKDDFLKLQTTPVTTPVTTPQTDPAVQKKLLDQYNSLVKTGKDALNGKRYDEAIKAFNDALALSVPDNKDATNGLAQAQQAKLTSKPTDNPQIKQQVQTFLNNYQDAMKNKNYPAALTALNQAAALAPQDAAVLKATNDYQTTMFEAGGCHPL